MPSMEFPPGYYPSAPTVLLLAAKAQHRFSVTGGNLGESEREELGTYLEEGTVTHGIPNGGGMERQGVGGGEGQPIAYTQLHMDHPRPIAVEGGAIG